MLPVSTTVRCPPNLPPLKALACLTLGVGVLYGAVACTPGHSSNAEAGEADEPAEGRGHSGGATMFQVTSPAVLDTQITKSYVAQVQSSHHIELRALERGYLNEVFVDEGQSVEKGQLLFKVLPTLYEAELQRARAEVSLAQVEYDNTAQLAGGNIVSAGELAMAKAKLDKAKAEEAIAGVHLKFTEVRAPFDGIVDRFEVRLGSLVDEGELLTTLSDNSRMWAYYNVPEAEYLDYEGERRRGDAKPEVSLLLANGQHFDHPGIVETVEADFDSETGNLPFRATFPNPEGLLRHGETGNVEMAIPLAAATLVPQKATYEVLDKKYVYVVAPGDSVASREIHVAAELEDLFVVAPGELAATDKILLEGLRKVRDGDHVTYEYREPDAVIRGLKLASE